MKLSRTFAVRLLKELALADRRPRTLKWTALNQLSRLSSLISLSSIFETRRDAPHTPVSCDPDIVVVPIAALLVPLSVVDNCTTFVPGGVVPYEEVSIVGVAAA
jgi:hypothetical protein